MLPRNELPLKRGFKFGAGLVVMMFLASGATAKPVPASPPPSRVLKLPQVIVKEDIDIPGVVRMFGRDVHLHAVVVKGHAVELILEYLRAFADAGFYIPPLAKLTQMSTSEYGIVAIDTVHWISHVVVFRAQSQESVMLTFGEVDLNQSVEKGDAHGFPVAKDARSLTRMDSEGGWVLSYSSALKPEAVQAFYDAALAGQRYEKLPAEGMPGDVYRRPGEELQVNATRRGEVTSVVVVGRTARSATTPSP